MNTLKIIITGCIACFLFVSCNNKEPEAFAYGNFESDDIFLSAESSGKILSMNINEGDLLKKNDLIAVIDTVQLYLKKLQIQSSRKAVATKISQLERQKNVNKVNITNLEREIKRFGNLFLEKAATKKQLDDLQGQLDMILAKNKTLDSQKSSVYAELNTIDVQIDQINDQLKRSYIYAPFSSTVIEKYAMEQELATLGRKLVKITDMSFLNLRVFIQGDQLSSLKLGEEVKVQYDGKNGLSQTTGRVSWISSEAEFTPKIIQTRDDRVSLVYAVKVRVDNDGSLKIGMPGEINLEN